MSVVEEVDVLKPTLVGRSSSHFTRVARIFALELRVEHEFEIVRDLKSKDMADYAGNPTLRLPILRVRSETWFGSLSICRQLHELSGRRRLVEWPEATAAVSLANAQELVAQAMATEVTVIMLKVAGGGTAGEYASKLERGLNNTMVWLNEHLNEALDCLRSERELSHFEVALFCLLEHLEFRQVVPIDGYSSLVRFRDAFGKRLSSKRTAYRFD